MRADPREEGTAHTTYRCEGEEATWGGGGVSHHFEWHYRDVGLVHGLTSVRWEGGDGGEGEVEKVREEDQSLCPTAETAWEGYFS